MFILVSTIRPALFFFPVVALLGGISLSAQVASHNEIKQLVEQHKTEFIETSKTIWGYAELGYHEEKSSTLLAGDLKQAGFQIQSGVADEPTGFMASYGRGKPVIAILGEFDALPGLSQAAVPDRSPVIDSAPGHGCGHNLLGSGAALAAVALKEYMEKAHITGTLRYYGTPAEEGGSGKVYMLRAGTISRRGCCAPLASRESKQRQQRWGACRNICKV